MILFFCYHVRQSKPGIIIPKVDWTSHILQIYAPTYRCIIIMYVSSFSFFTFYLFFIIILIIILILFPFIQFFAMTIMGYHTLHIFKSKYIVFLKIPFDKKKEKKSYFRVPCKPSSDTADL